MTTPDFFQHLHKVFQGRGFSFFFDEKSFEPPPQMSTKEQLLVHSIRSLARLSIGLPLLFQNSNIYEQNKEAVTGDLKQLQKHCDLIGIKDNFGNCRLMLAISADDVADESLVGRLAIIHEQAQHFQKYAADLNPLKARPWIKKAMGVPEGGRVWCVVFLTFSAHKRAREFFESHITKCKHGGFWKHTHTLPYVVDLEDETIQNHAGKKDENLAAAIFKGQIESTVTEEPTE